MKRRYSLLSLLLLLLSNTVLAQSESLPQPKELDAAVDFWTRIYTGVTTSGGLLHDSWQLDVVYDEMSFPDGLSYRQRSQWIKAKRERYKKLLRSIARKQGRHLTAEEANVYALWPEGTSPQRLREAAKSIRFQRGQADNFRKAVVRSGRWEQFVRRTFRDQGLPEELWMLPFVESSFNPEAYSSVGAAGIWQFTRATGRRYLRIDHVVDERRDPIKATAAAAQLLAHNYEMLQSWPVAITAYNHGAAGMRRAVEKVGSSRIEKLIAEYDGRTFGFASRNFYAEFLAAKRVFENAKHYFGDLLRTHPSSVEVVELPAYVNAERLAAELAIDLKELQQNNLALRPSVWRGDKLIPKGYLLQLPRDGSKRSYQQQVAELDAALFSDQQIRDTFYKVQSGDALSKIAKRYQIKVKDLMEANNLNSRHFIRVGQVLTLPTGMPEQEVEPLLVKAALVTEMTMSIEVEAEESQALDEAESLTAMVVVPSAEPVEELAEGNEQHSAASEDPIDYSVLKGDQVVVEAAETLGHYAEWLNIGTKHLRRINGLKYGQALSVGQRVKLRFSRVSSQQFEQKRIAYHQALQEEYFQRYQIRTTEQYTIRQGDSLWELAQSIYNVPLWLLRQYNPDVNFNGIHPGITITVPRVERLKREAEPKRQDESVAANL